MNGNKSTSAHDWAGSAFGAQKVRSSRDCRWSATRLAACRLLVEERKVRWALGHRSCPWPRMPPAVGAHQTYRRKGKVRSEAKRTTPSQRIHQSLAMRRRRLRRPFARRSISPATRRSTPRGSCIACEQENPRCARQLEPGQSRHQRPWQKNHTTSRRSPTARSARHKQSSANDTIVS